MQRHRQIEKRTGGLVRVTLGSTIVTHGKGIGGTPVKKPIFCMALGSQVFHEVAFTATDNLNGGQVDICIEKCNFGCFPIEGI